MFKVRWQGGPWETPPTPPYISDWLRALSPRDLTLLQMRCLACRHPGCRLEPCAIELAWEMVHGVAHGPSH